MNRIKVCTWNIGSSYKNNTFSNVIDVLKEINPDVLCIQEMLEEPEYINAISGGVSLPLLEYRRLSQSTYRNDKNMGIAIFSKMEIYKTDFLYMSAPSLCFEYEGKREVIHNKGFLYCKFNNLDLITGHFFPFYRYQLNDFDFRNYYDILDNWMCKKAEDSSKMIIAGDFNSNNCKELLWRTFSKLDCAIDGITRPIHRGGDCIYYDKTYQLIEAHNLFRKEDHHVCFAILEK